MALSERDIEALAERILQGAEERYVAELTEAVVSRFSDLAGRLGDAAALEQLALGLPDIAAAILAKHQGSIDSQVVAEVQAVLEASAAADDAALAALYGPEAAAKAASWFPTGATSHFKEMALQTARGLADVIRRQNVMMADAAASLWYRVAGEAVTAANLGLVPYDKLVAEGVAKLADAGISVVEYARDGKRTVANMADVAMRRHIYTQVSQASGRMALERMRAYGHELVVTSSHYGARPSHAGWQGLACRISGPGMVDGVRYPGLAELTGYGTVGGLQGANCRHSINPYHPGITELPAREWPEHEARFGCSSEDNYEATQRQRELERRIRKTKREVVALEQAGIGLEDATYVQKRLLLGRQQQTLAAWCRERKLVRQPARERAYGVARQPRALKGAKWQTREQGIARKRMAEPGAKVDLRRIQSSEYRRKFDGLTGNPLADEEACRCARAALAHRSSTYGEDLYLVSVVTGERVLSLTGSTEYLGVTPTRELLDTLREQPRGTLLSIHNHPSNIPPTGSDFAAADARGYAGAIVALHNGEVYFYRQGHTGFSAREFDAAVERLKEKGVAELSAFERVLDDFERRFGIAWRRIGEL